MNNWPPTGTDDTRLWRVKLKRGGYWYRAVAGEDHAGSLISLGGSWREDTLRYTTFTTLEAVRTTWAEPQYNYKGPIGGSHAWRWELVGYCIPINEDDG